MRVPRALVCTCREFPRARRDMRSIEREVQLPNTNIDSDAISATAENGMLCIVVPKLKPADRPTPRIILVRTTCVLK